MVVRQQPLTLKEPPIVQQVGPEQPVSGMLHVCDSMCVFVYVCMYACMYVCIHTYMHVCLCTHFHICMYACMYAQTHVCMYAFTGRLCGIGMLLGKSDASKAIYVKQLVPQSPAHLSARIRVQVLLDMTILLFCYSAILLY